MPFKKGQTTIFIITGIVLVLAVALTLYTQEFYKTKVITEEIEDNAKQLLEPKNFKSYVETCLHDKAYPLIIGLSLQGGTLKGLTSNTYELLPNGNSRIYYNSTYRYFCKNDLEHGCVNNIITRQDMEKELNQNITNIISECVNLTIFEKIGYNITNKSLKVNSTIAVDEVNIVLDYPITITKGDFSLNIPQFLAIVKIPLGRVYDLAVNITNEEILKGRFEKDEWMKQNNVDIMVEKHKPYPDTVYKLTKFDKKQNKNFTFNFAVQGADEVSLIGKDEPLALFDYCYFESDKNCFANSNDVDCAAKGGIYTKTPPTCSGLAVFNEKTCEGAECNDCAEINKKHGDTWCVYDSVVGAGLDRVGTRHYQHSCINGIRYIEECKDFRAEICVNPEEKAVCRVNRWHDCYLQNSKNDCENKDERDCFWNLYVSTTGAVSGKCIPHFPPGFRFWLGQEPNVCDLGNDVGNCPNEVHININAPGYNIKEDYNKRATCPNVWADLSVSNCYSQGDCGNYRNVNGELTEFGFYNSQYQMRNKPISKFAYLDKDIDPSTYNVNDLPADVYNKKVGIIYNPHPTDLEIFDFINKYINKAKGWEPCGSCGDDAFECDCYLCMVCIPVKQYYEHFLKYIVGASMCDPWKAPNDDKSCNTCNNDPEKPCAEYKCKSLGRKCVYTETNKIGIGKCEKLSESPKKNEYEEPLKIEITHLPYGYSLTETTTEWGNDFFEGFSISPNIALSTDFIIKMKTNRNALCKTSFIPQLPFYNIYSKLIDDPFKTEQIDNTNYQIKVNVGSANMLKKRLLKMVGYNNLLEVAYSYVTKEDVKEDARAYLQQMYIPQFSGIAQNLIIMMQANQRIFFIKCIDDMGNENKDNIFIKFSVTDEDNEPPIISYFELAQDASNLIFKFNVGDNPSYTTPFCELRLGKINSSGGVENWKPYKTEYQINKNILKEVNLNKIEHLLEANAQYKAGMLCDDGVNEVSSENKTIIIT